MAFAFSYAKNNDIDYYFQDEFFFRDNSEAVRALFSSDIPPLCNRVAIHVRRGDYVNNKFYVDLMDTDYYERAMKEFPAGTKFLVFSDDIEWCEKQPIFKDCEFSYGSELEDLNMMASCKGHIIANSSFSWWGAWLCPDYPNNKVIAPKAWYADGDNSRTILPGHWVRI